MTNTAARPEMTRTEQAEASLDVPPGVNGRQREAYLSLTDQQKRVYRFSWFVRGRLASHCHQDALWAELKDRHGYR